jgi:hypothetical protein
VMRGIGWVPFTACPCRSRICSSRELFARCMVPASGRTLSPKRTRPLWRSSSRRAPS